jgi:hypothetical protein
VKRNVVALCDIPRGRPGRPSKALTLDQAQALLNAAEYTTLYAYIVLSVAKKAAGKPEFDSSRAHEGRSRGIAAGQRGGWVRPG